MCWQDQIRRAFECLFETNPLARIALVGVGHELRGDDAAGLLLAQRLQSMLDSQYVLVVEAGPVPENFSGVLRRFAPDLTLVIDAARMGAAPGAVRWLDWKDVRQANISTHTSSLCLLADFLARELDCPVALLGIQPATLSFDAPLSPLVQEACDQVCKLLLDVLPLDWAIAPTNFPLCQRLLSKTAASDGAWIWKNSRSTEERIR